MLSKRLSVISVQASEMSSVPHFVAGGLLTEPSSSASAVVRNPGTGQIIANVYEAGEATIEKCLESAVSAQRRWILTSVKQRANIMFGFRQLLLDQQMWFVETITREHGKHETDALASFMKGIETLDYALALPAVISGRTLEVSSGVTCQDRRQPVGVTLSIVPFNFPVMVPMWTLPIALMLGNAVIMKPSEKVPSCLVKMGELLKTAGLPDGVYSVLQGGPKLVDRLIKDSRINAVTFVGSTPVAKIVYDLTNAAEGNKRALCLGGAKNHLVANSDCDIDMTASDVVASFAGSSGQRCMAASVLLVVDSTTGNLAEHALVRKIVDKAAALQPGQTGLSRMGPVIDEAALRRITRYVGNSEDQYGAKVVLDGRKWTAEKQTGFWIGPTVIIHQPVSEDPALSEEIFGPVLSVLKVQSIEEAVARINAHPYGNAACIYTSNGGLAEAFTKTVNVGMIGVNIGVPVPREPFSFGGTKHSKFGITDITGDGLVEFLTHRIKITTKWSSRKETCGNDLVAEAFVK